MASALVWNKRGLTAGGVSASCVWLAIKVKVSKQWWWSLAAVTAVTLGLLLYFFSPQQYALYPRCAFFALTGLECPGCGGLRAAHYLLHGELGTAFRYNPLLVTLLPVTLFAGMVYWLGRKHNWAVVTRFQNTSWLWILVAAVVVFGVARNLPFGPLAHLHP